MGDYAQNDFDALYRNRYDYLLRLAYRSTKNYHDSEDLVDEAFVVYLQKSATIHISNPNAYLVKVLSNLICNYQRLKIHDNIPLSSILENELGVDGLKRGLADALPSGLLPWERGAATTQRGELPRKTVRAKAHFAELRQEEK